ncbi:hypothetical protein MVES1_000451 [Malassezia vespertilionis]|nr:uncharacterized protein MVES1_000451 [Malassezia vespertilionis]WFD05125.1 hypothetical protein MVES1_000451 [Malassezia vespertilionis]
MSGAENSVQKQHEESTAVYEGIGRYAAYAARLRTLITTGSRYIAYSSDIGEAFRPLTKPIVVSAAYGISWAYIISDVGYTVWHASNHMDPNDSSYKKDLAWIGARRTVFQTLASMFLPALTIHSVVRYSAPLFSKFSNMRARSIGPTVLGLCTVPLLPVLFDHPVEYAVENAFDLVELKAAALQGDAAAQQSFDKKFAEMKNSMLGSKPKVQEPKRIVDTIPSDTPLDGSTVQKLAILGIGIDMVSMPRMRQLLVRQAKRLASSPLYRPLAVAPRYADTASPAESQEPKLLAAAAQHFARRTLSNAESDFWATFAAQAGHEDHLRFLATR